jgi:hypothetical protein
MKCNKDYSLWRRIVSTCDQTMAPAKNARVCIISFSAFSPTLVTNSPDFCIKISSSHKPKHLHREIDGSKGFVLPSKTREELYSTVLWYPLK